jgi:hypothetical protein
MKKRILAAVLCASAVAAVAASGASAAAPSTLSGEVLAGSVTSFDGCPVVSTETVSFGASGTAAGPYPGTFSETGTFTIRNAGVPGYFFVESFSATFAITSGTTTISGTKQGGESGIVECGPDSGNWILDMSTTTYSATITSPSGSFHDEGATNVAGSFDASSPASVFSETFSSTLPAPISLLPTSKDQCKDGGSPSFGVFKNQGDCVSFVASKGKNGRNG